jgi:hypothetical protein
MIAAGHVNATIDEEEGMVRFSDSKQDAPVTSSMLRERVAKISTLQSLLTDATRQAKLEHKLVASLMRHAEVAVPGVDSTSLQAAGAIAQPEAIDLTPDLMGDL